MTTIGDAASDSRGALRLPTGVPSERSFYHGAFVKTPVPGLHESVVYPDLASLYPNLLRTLNASPETLVGGEDALRASEYDERDCVWGYYDPRPVKRCEAHEHWSEYTDGEYKAVRAKNSSGSWTTKWVDDPEFERLYYLHPDVREGFISGTVDDMIGLKEVYRGTERYEAVKRIVNSLYGFIGYSTEHTASRLFDDRIAESITLTGQKVIKYTANEMVNYLDDSGVDAQWIYGDTDSCVISMPSVNSKDDALAYAFDAADYVNDSYDEFMRDCCGIDEHHMEVEIESYSPNTYLHHKKKRYFQHVTWDDDDGHDADEENVKGFAYVRSDTSDVTEDAQEFVVKQLLYEGYDDAKANIYEYLRELKDEITSGERPLNELGERSGIGQPLDEYGSENRRPMPLVRGAKYANENVENVSLGEGDKPMKFPVERLLDDSLPRTYTAETAEDGDVVDYISVEDTRRIGGLVSVDYDEVWEKQVADRVDHILQNVGMSVEAAIEGHEQGNISDFW